MPTTKTVLLYQYDELSEQAKERARQWYVDGMESWEYADSVIEDAAECARILGIEIASRDYKTVGGQTKSEPAIHFSGFWSQGDGASFDGRYSYARESVRNIKEHAPQDSTLHAIAQALADVQRKHFYKLRASCKQSGHYMHSGCMSVHVTHAGDESRDIPAADERAIRDALRKFADWVYSQLRAEYEYRSSDEQVEESMRSNAYTFNESGKRES